MNKLVASIVLAIVFLAVVTAAVSQVVLDQSSVTRTRTRDITDVQIIFNPEGSIAIRGTIGVTIKTGTNIVSQRGLATVTLANADLVAALSTVGLPNQNVIRDRFITLFQSAWTNQLGVIVVNGTESE